MGRLLGPPHGTKPAAVIANEILRFYPLEVIYYNTYLKHIFNLIAVQL